MDSAVAQAIVVLLLLTSTCILSATRQLQLAHVVCRHGDRSPSQAYPKDPYQESAWPQGFAQMTPTGIAEMVRLGGLLRRRYVPHLIRANYTRKEVYVRATDRDRTLQSALATLAGLFPDEAAPSSASYYPVPVHSTLPAEQDLLLKPSSVPCPHYDALYHANSAPVAADYNEKYRDFFTKLGELTGLVPYDLESGIQDTYTALFRERANNFTLPPWADEVWEKPNATVFDEIVRLKNVAFDLKYKTPEMWKIRGGYLLGDIVQRSEQKARQPTSEAVPNLILYVAHDGTVAPLLYAFGLADGRIPAYASCVIVELHSEDGDAPVVSVSFRDGPTADTAPPRPLRFCRSQTYCPLEEFVSAMRPHIFASAEEWRRECRLPGSTCSTCSRWPNVLAVLALILSVALATVVVWLLWRLRRHGYQPAPLRCWS